MSDQSLLCQSWKKITKKGAVSHGEKRNTKQRKEKVQKKRSKEREEEKGQKEQRSTKETLNAENSKEEDSRHGQTQESAGGMQERRHCSGQGNMCRTRHKWQPSVQELPA